MIPPPVWANEVHILGAWFLGTSAGAIVCPTRAAAERVRMLIEEHGWHDTPACPDTLEGMPW